MKRLDLTEKQLYYLSDLIENCMSDTWLGSRWRECHHSNTELFELAEVRRKLWNLGHPYTKDEVIGELEDA